MGNRLAKKGFTATGVDLLGPRLAENMNVVLVSDKVSKLHRLAEMMGTVLFERRLTTVLIDTYSGMGSWYALVCSFVARLRGARVVLSLHGGKLPERVKRYPRYFGFLFKRAHRLVVPSGYLGAVVKQMGFEATEIANGIHTAEFPFTPRRRCEGRLLFVRSLRRIYRPEMAIRLVAELKHRGKSAYLEIVGPDPEHRLHELTELARSLGVAELIAFKGLLSQREWVGLSMDCDVMINTSSMDNQPFTLLEAMALGLPVVTTDVGGIPYLVQHEGNGLMVGSDVQQLADQVMRLMDHPELVMQLSHAGKAFADQRDWSRIVASWRAALAPDD